MQTRMRTLLSALIVGLVAAVAAPSARADFNLIITENGGASLVIADGGAGDTDGIVNGSISADTTLINGFLTTFSFSSLGATSNRLDSPLSTGDLAELTHSGLVSRLAGTPGTSSLSIISTDTDFSFAGAGLTGNLLTTASDSYSNTAAGDSRTFQSYYDSTNTDLSSPPPVGTAGTLVAFPFGGTNSQSVFQLLNPVGALAPTFALSNETIITLGPTTSVSNPPRDLFNGITQVQAVPEPSSILMVTLGVPAVGLIALRHRRTARA